MLRGRQENVLGLKVDGEDDAPLARIDTEYNLETAQPQARADFLKQTANCSGSVKFVLLLNIHY
jgi:hypothetical protein